MQKIIKNNKTTNLTRAIIMLSKNGVENEEKMLVSKIENACYDLIDITHNEEDKVGDTLAYMYDLFIIAKQVSLFKEENTLFILSAIKNILSDYETKIKDNTSDDLSKNIKDILSEVCVKSENDYTPFITKRTEMKSLENVKDEHSNPSKTSETKNENKKTEVKYFTKVENREVTKIRDTQSDRSENLKDFSNSNRHAENSNRKLSRRDEVLKVLSSVPVSIKDVSDKVLGCSEKTLQRELNALVDTRQAIRIGEKRWSRYVLA